MKSLGCSQILMKEYFMHPGKRNSVKELSDDGFENIVIIIDPGIRTIDKE
jgi:hypothetical protein